MILLPIVYALHNFSERKFLLCVSQQILEVAVCALGISNTFKIIQLKKVTEHRWKSSIPGSDGLDSNA